MPVEAHDRKPLQAQSNGLKSTQANSIDLKENLYHPISAMPAFANSKQSSATRANLIRIATVQREPTYQPKDLATGSRAQGQRQTGKGANPLKHVQCMNFPHQRCREFMHSTKSTRGRRPETGNQNPLQLRSAPGIYSYPERTTSVELEKRERVSAALPRGSHNIPRRRQQK